MSTLDAAALVAALSEESAASTPNPFCDPRGAPDPNTFPVPRWASYCPSRSPQFKPHSSLGLTKAAVCGRYLGGGRYTEIKGKRTYERPMEQAWVFEFVEGRWVLRFSIPAGTYKSEHPLWNE